MELIRELEKESWNVVIDELLWHLRESRLPVSINRKFSPVRAIEFHFSDLVTMFLPVKNQFLEGHWDEACQIIARFPQLHKIELRDGA